MVIQPLHRVGEGCKYISMVLVLAGLIPLWGQSNPSKEYIRIGDRVIAIENAPPQAPPTVSFGTPSTGTSLLSTSGSGTVAVNNPQGVSWGVVSDAPWFSLTGATTGPPSAGINFSFQANSGVGRTATLTLTATGLSPQTLMFNQAGTGGSLVLSPSSATLVSRASNQTIQINSSASWTAAVTSNSPWLTLGTSSGPAGLTTLGYSVTDNNGAQRQGIITVSGSIQQTFTVTQSAIQSVTVGPLLVRLAYNGQFVFTPYVDGVAVPGSTVNWSVTQVSGGLGSISPSGFYTAPSGDAQNSVKVTYSGFTSNIATVQVLATTSSPIVESFSPNGGTGNGATFTILAKDPNGIDTDLQYVEFGFAQDPNQPTLNGDCALMVGPYMPVYPAVISYLNNFSVNGGFPNPFAAPLNNSSNCNVSVAQATTSRNDPTNEITFNLPISFHTGTASASKTVWMWPIPRIAQLGPRVNIGTYTITGAPTLGPLTPPTGVGNSQNFTSKHAWGANASGMTSAEILINSSTNTGAACNVKYDNVTHLFYLRNDAGTGWLSPGIVAGSSQTAQNSQCTFSGAESQATVANGALTLVTPLSFTSAFFGARFIYLEALDNNNADSGYQQWGYWTVEVTCLR